ncbi:MAG: hypothetical protein M1428_04190 [Deltaproteobacteria bacterium]|nr:hypothetical protein [Deltaproteobacteria bacterium]
MTEIVKLLVLVPNFKILYKKVILIGTPEGVNDMASIFSSVKAIKQGIPCRY